jgi:hypothetical protein
LLPERFEFRPVPRTRGRDQTLPVADAPCKAQISQHQIDFVGKDSHGSRRDALCQAALFQVEHVARDGNHRLPAAARRFDHDRNAVGVDRAEGKDLGKSARVRETGPRPDRQIMQGPVELGACRGEKDARSDKAGIAEQLRSDDRLKIVCGQLAELRSRRSEGEAAERRLEPEGAIGGH